MALDQPMAPKRVAAYLGLGTLLLAWLSSAAGIIEQPPDVPEPPTPVQTAGTETLAADVQAQASRLRERLAAAPALQAPLRNPFEFVNRQVGRSARPSAVAARTSAPPAPPVIPDPPLVLIGIAEDETAQGVVRTAIIAADSGELLMVTPGETIGARYKVAAVGADAVELTDLVTGGVRRLALR